MQAVEIEALNRRALDESFLIDMKVVGDESNPKMAKALAQQKTIIEIVHSNAVTMIGQLKVRAIADIIAWCVVFVVSGLALFLNHRKQAEMEKKGSG